MLSFQLPFRPDDVHSSGWKLVFQQKPMYCSREYFFKTSRLIQQYEKPTSNYSCLLLYCFLPFIQLSFYITQHLYACKLGKLSVKMSLQIILFVTDMDYWYIPEMGIPTWYQEKTSTFCIFCNGLWIQSFLCNRWVSVFSPSLSKWSDTQHLDL